jgi:hypothetical protein
MKKVTIQRVQFSAGTPLEYFMIFFRCRSIIFAAIILIFFGIVVFSLTWTQSRSKRNVILLIVDTLRPDKLGIYGFPVDTSPEIDELGKNGALFQRVVAQSSWTRPSIGSFLTSKYPRQLGIYDEKWDILPDKFVTIAEDLSRSGYYTIGLTANPNINKIFNFHQGFDVYVDSQDVWSWLKSNSERSQKNDQFKAESAGSILERALGFMAQKDRDRLGYVQVNLLDVHEYLTLRSSDVAPEFREQESPRYLQSIRNVSKEIGKFVAKVRVLSGWENTLFIVVSDHGEGLGDHPGVDISSGHGDHLYESTTLVPLIFYDPDSPKLQTRKIKQQVQLIDLKPTVLDYLGIRSSDEEEGVSLVPLLEGRDLSDDYPREAFSETSWKGLNRRACFADKHYYLLSEPVWGGTNPEELQEAEKISNGQATDVSYIFADEFKKLQRKLNQWEHSYPLEAAQQPITKVDSSLINQLKTLGYAK